MVLKIFSFKGKEFQKTACVVGCLGREEKHRKEGESEWKGSSVWSHTHTHTHSQEMPWKSWKWLSCCRVINCQGLNICHTSKVSLKLSVLSHISEMAPIANWLKTKSHSVLKNVSCLSLSWTLILSGKLFRSANFGVPLRPQWPDSRWKQCSDVARPS